MMTELKDPRLNDVMITINEVQASRDLSQAQVWVSVLGDEAQTKAAVAGLNQARGYLKKLVGERMTLKSIPALHFKLDETGRRAARIQELLVQAEKQPKAKSQPSEDAGEKP